MTAAAAVRARAPKVTPELVAAVNDRERVTDHDVAAFVDVVQDAIGAPEGSWVHYGLTSSDVVDTATVRHPDARRRPAPRRLGRAACRCSRPAPSSSWTRPCRAAPTACTPSPPPSGPSWRCGACRPTATGAGCAPPATRWRWGSCRGRWAPTPTSTPGSRPTCAAPSGSRPCPPPRSSPATATPSCCGRAPRSGATIEMIGTEIRHLARTEVGEVEEAFGVGPEGQLGHAPQAQPDPVRAPERPGPGAARLSGGGARGRGPVARARHLPQLGGARHPPRRLPAHLLRAAPRRRAGPEPGGPRRAHAGQRARGLVRARVQPAGAPGAGGVGDGPRRRLPHRPARRPAGLGGEAARSGASSRPTPRSRLDARRRSTGLQPGHAALQHVSTGSRQAPYEEVEG